MYMYIQYVCVHVRCTCIHVYIPAINHNNAVVRHELGATLALCKLLAKGTHAYNIYMTE